MKIWIVILISLFTLQGILSADTVELRTLDQLPPKTQEFMKVHFPGSEVSYIDQERNFLSKVYRVIFTNGDKLEFDKSGNWMEIDCEQSVLPTSVIPRSILNHVGEKYAGTRIVQMERNRSSYEVELTNGLTLKFNKHSQVTEIS